MPFATSFYRHPFSPSFSQTSPHMVYFTPDYSPIRLMSMQALEVWDLQVLVHSHRPFHGGKRDWDIIVMISILTLSRSWGPLWISKHKRVMELYFPVNGLFLGMVRRYPALFGAESKRTQNCQVRTLYDRFLRVLWCCIARHPWSPSNIYKPRRSHRLRIPSLRPVRQSSLPSR